VSQGKSGGHLDGIIRVGSTNLGNHALIAQEQNQERLAGGDQLIPGS